MTAFYASMWHVLTSMVPCSKWTSTTFMTIEQHEDVTKARKARNDRDSYAVLGFVQ